MAELPQIRVIHVMHDTNAEIKDIDIRVSVVNPSQEVLDELLRLVETRALITLGGVP